MDLARQPSSAKQKGIMPKYEPSDEEMETYGASAPATSPDESESDAEKQSVDEEESGADTAVISNKILSPDGEPLKEGDEIVVQVVKNYGDESEIKYAPKKEGDYSEEEPMSQEASELAAMSEEGE